MREREREIEKRHVISAQLGVLREMKQPCREKRSNGTKK